MQNAGAKEGPWPADLRERRGWTVRHRRNSGCRCSAASQLSGPDGPVDLPNKKLAGLLAYLACTAPEPQPREKLTALLWGSHFDAQAKQNLRQALFRLRKVLGQDALLSDGEEVSLAPPSSTATWSQFEALIRDGSRDALAEAADLYRGRFLDDVAITRGGMGDWLTAERERLEGLALGALVRLAEQELPAGDGEQALKPPSARSRSTTCARMRIG